MSQVPNTSLFRSIPQVDEVLNDPSIAALEETISRPLIVEAIRDSLADIREAIAQGTLTELSKDMVVAATLKRAHTYRQLSLRRVINATGIIIHTNLGRSILAQSALDAVVEAARGYSTLEYNTTTMQRGSRHDHCEKLLCTLTGAESAIAVNNNAAAVMMVLSEFAAEKEVVVSRGELVEIGGSFRVPDIMRQSHATMVEVGTTNKTHAFDYEHAITEQTGLLLKVHPSNYSMVGFTESVSLEQLRTIADHENASRASNIVVYEDQGSGSLIDLSFLGPHAEPPVKKSIEQGCDLVSFSGDKLLGGPQAGIIVGSKQLIDRLKKNPLARALRLDKMSLAALEATLRLYL
ncbi:MAG: L-seryl-tRNA(Sec) selenium transferase, partial [Raoultibacter sp.]